ncbi:malto-oligosyltrehalose trehalohydrolase [Nostocoides sp. F2B08]|uniref:malto-oligosyltrehalose trehalohydrolase n=1 Tax=Nostocoides sp. F2B08 TaxID=2653936 RepID=UPI0012638A2F|nr:malto-oligosyltrehalose trehalohydrolase [Tetrasphaera sp. F2B08]KAB7743271.1 malto-oligosyltrehalose trehalohydrolase [Tetrasphaera sp. F2B08]
MISVWAPNAETVEIDAIADGEPLRETMRKGRGGWWRWDGDPGEHDVFDYGFVLDRGTVLPDPRSAWQPYGVHRRSRWWSGAPLRRRDREWRGPRGGAGTLGGVVYEMHVGTFTPQGTLDSAVERLDHLVDLGVDVVQVMPLAAFPGRRGWGYDGVGFYSVHDAYGGPDAFIRFVDACHARGLGVCLDVVYNHLGPVGNYLGLFGPYFTDTHDTPWGWAVNLDAEHSDVVRGFIVDAATRWFELFGVDALRLDAVHELKDDTPERDGGPHLLAELSEATAALAERVERPLDLIAESDLNDATMITPVADGGLGMSAQWADDVHHALHVALTGETQGYYGDFADPEALTKTLTRAFFHDGSFSTFRGEEWGAPVDPATVSGHRFVAYLQTHDQVGNRATGDRIGASVTPGQQAAGAALYLLSAFTPMVFMGEEWAASTPWQYFTDFRDPEMGRAVSEGRRAEFAEHGWVDGGVPDPQDESTRDASVLRWDEVGVGDHRAMLLWYRRLIELRRSEPDLADPDLRAVAVERDADAGWVVVRRGAFRVVANLGSEEVRAPLEGTVGEVTASFGEVPNPRRGAHTVRVGGHSVAVVRTA